MAILIVGLVIGVLVAVVMAILLEGPVERGEFDDPGDDVVRPSARPAPRRAHHS